MNDPTDLKSPRGKLAVAREWLDTGGIVPADAIVMTGLADTLEAALDENGRLELIVAVNHGLWRSAEAELLGAQAENKRLREDVTEAKSSEARTWSSNLLWQEEAERLRGIIAELNERLDKPIRPYADRRIPMSTEREFLREAYGDSLVDDLEAILAKAVQS